MGKLFGTDGIRGIAGEFLTAELAIKIGRAAAEVLGGEHRPLVLIGKDTRISSDMLECSLIAGLTAAGADVLRLGVIPTPAVAYLSVLHNADAGIVISASHNSFEHNGIKIFNGRGYKLSDELEAAIEEHVLSDRDPKNIAFDGFGRLIYPQTEPLEEYIRHLVQAAEGGNGKVRVLVDCANGAACAVAPELFERLGIKAEFIGCKPDGININANCGSTHLKNLKEKVVRGGYDLGIAFDGDADRCLAVDENGDEVDGDKIMAACAQYERERGRLDHDAIVATVMSNMGMHVYCRENGFKLVCTDVGDRHVLEKMLECGYCIGGEQSGHIIFTRFATTGDGELAALRLLKAMDEKGCTLSELVEAVPVYPQIMLNVKVGGNEEKKRIMEDRTLQKAVIDGEKELDGNGRILVRASGTEALIRVMVEAKTEETALNMARKLADLVERL